MCALQYAAQTEMNKEKQSSENDPDNQKLKELIDMIDVHMAEYNVL